MDATEQERLEGRLARLKRLLLQTTDPAVATVISDDIAEVESRIRAARSPTDLQAKGGPFGVLSDRSPGSRGEL